MLLHPLSPTLFLVIYTKHFISTGYATSLIVIGIYKIWQISCRVHSNKTSAHTVWVKKIPPEDLWQFFQNGWEFFNQITHAYYAFLSTLDYEFLFNYLQFWQSSAILSVTTQFTSCAQYVHYRRKRTLAFSDIFPKQLGIFRPNFTRLLNVRMFARMQIFITTTCRLCMDESLTLYSLKHNIYFFMCVFKLLC